MKAMSIVCWWLLLVNSISQERQPRSELATVVIYRGREFGGRTFRLYANDQKIGDLSTNQTIRVVLPPGSVRLESKRDYYTINKRIMFTVAAGQTYYIKAVEDIDFMSRTLLMALVSDEQAQRELNRKKEGTPEPTGKLD